MSMPSLPDSVLDITREQALNMILASIAMEELGLSHIINAEGEKLQFVIKNMEDCGCAGIQEILEVNRSVTCLLDSVMQNQFLLKGKLDKVLNMCEPPVPTSPRPPSCDTPPPAKQSCGFCQEHCCSQRNSITCDTSEFLWKSGCRLPWRCLAQTGETMSLKAADPFAIYLCSGRQYRISLLIQVKVNSCAESIHIAVQKLGCDGHQELTLYRVPSIKSKKETVTFSGNMRLCINPEKQMFFPVSFVLFNPEELMVDMATINISQV